MKLAKDRLDVGLMTGDPAMIEFISDEVGLGGHEELAVSREVTQHRFDVDGSVVKINVVDGLRPQGRSGYGEVRIARAEAAEPTRHEGPDGVAIVVGPPGHLGVEQLGVRLDVPDRAEARRYFDHVLGWDVDGDMVRLGVSVVQLVEEATAPTEVALPVAGWSYLTVQIHDCDGETDAAVARGARLEAPARTLGDVARFSMIADPWGNQLEISQRASLTGPLPSVR